MRIDTYQDMKVPGIKLLKEGSFDEGIQQLKLYSDIHPNDIDVLTILAEYFLKIKQSDLAYEYFSKALAINPVDTSNLVNFASLELKGPSYLTALKSIHSRLNPRRYIEIGVCKGASFKLVSTDVIAVGIDPEPQLDINALPEKHVIRAETSDSYFDSGQIDTDLEGSQFDMAFLDGMHLFEFVLRDFINLEKYSKISSTIFVHDLYPINAETAGRERIADFWSGDVWKLVLCLKEYRKDLEISILPCAPTGLGVIAKLDANSTVLSNKYDEILEKYIDLSFSTLEHNKAKKLMLESPDCFWFDC